MPKQKKKNWKKKQQQWPAQANGGADLEKSIFVKGPPRRINEQDLFNCFSSYGNIENIVIPRDFYAFVNFYSKVSAIRALQDEIVLKSYGYRVGSRKLSKANKTAMASKEEKDETDPLDLNILMEQTGPGRDLDAQIKTMCNLILLEKPEAQVREEFCLRFQYILRTYFPACTIKVCGSSANGFGFKDCDIDAFVNFGPMTKSNATVKEFSLQAVERGKVSLQHLQSLPKVKKLRFTMQVLRQQVPNVSHILFIPSRRCPIITFEVDSIGLSCDLSCMNELIVHNTALLKFLGQLDSRAPLLVAVLRYWGKHHDLVGKGAKLTSYAFTWLVLVYLQSLEKPVLPTVEELSSLATETEVVNVDQENLDGSLLSRKWDCSFTKDASLIARSENSMTLGQLLIGFFEFVADLNLKNSVICTRTATIMTRPQFCALVDVSTAEIFQMHCMCIQDPFDLTHNIAASVNEGCMVNLTYAAQTVCRTLKASKNLFDIYTANVQVPEIEVITKLPDQIFPLHELYLPVKTFTKDGMSTEVVTKRMCDSILLILDAYLIDSVVLEAGGCSSSTNESSSKKICADQRRKKNCDAAHSLVIDASSRTSTSSINSPNLKHGSCSNDSFHQGMKRKAHDAELVNNWRVLLKLGCKAKHRVWTQRRKPRPDELARPWELLQVERKISELAAEQAVSKFPDCNVEFLCVVTLINMECGPVVSVILNNTSKYREFKGVCNVLFRGSFFRLIEACMLEVPTTTG